MSDPYSDLAAQDASMQARIADAMEARCLEPAQVDIRRSYLGPIDLLPGASAVELGSGTGHVTQELSTLWTMRQIAELLTEAGFELGQRRGHGYVAEGEATYFLTIIDRGADRMAETGLLARATADP